jgi:hypothetical protein
MVYLKRQSQISMTRTRTLYHHVTHILLLAMLSVYCSGWMLLEPKNGRVFWKPSMIQMAVKITGSIFPKNFRSELLTLHVTKQINNTDTTRSISKYDIYWNAALERVVDYKNEFGHTSIPFSYRGGQVPNLGRWVATQRCRYRNKTLQIEKVQKLESLGFSWTSTVHQYGWQSCFDRLLKFYQKFGYADVPYTYNDGEDPHLGSWMRSQRTKYKTKTLIKERVQKLESLGVTWRFTAEQFSNLQRDEETWLRALERFKAYQECYGRRNVPRNFTDGEEPHLGAWVETQRKEFQQKQRSNGTATILTQEREDLLTSAGFIWELRRQPRYDSEWMTQFERLKAYKDKYNSTMAKPRSTGIDCVIAPTCLWAKQQRSQYNKFLANEPSAMTQEKVDILNSIDFAWRLENKTSHERWLHSYFKLYWHHFEYNNTNVTLSSGYNSAFVNWVFKQKKLYQAGKLDQGKIDLMNELNFVWETDPAPNWEEMFEELSQYKEQFGSTVVHKIINLELGRWTAEMRKLYEAGNLDPEWTRNLNSLNFKWNVVDVNWNAMVDRLAAYKAKHNSVCVPDEWHLDPPLGHWVKTVRAKFVDCLNANRTIDEDMIPEIAKAMASSKLSSEVYAARLRQLHHLGFVWDPHEVRWMEMYERLLLYVEEHNSTLVPETYDPDQQLGNWVATQRQRRAAGKLSPKRVELLYKIGFKWDLVS